MNPMERHTSTVQSVCELGAGLFANFKFFRCPIKIGIEIIPSYVHNRYRKDNIAICGDIRNFESLLEDEGFDKVDMFLLYDVIEHLERDDALDLLNRLKDKCNKKILIWAPIGQHKQDGDGESWYIGDKSLIKKLECDRELAIESQRHKSTWTVGDFENLGFRVDLKKDYYRASNQYWSGRKDEFIAKFGKETGDAAWCLWIK